MSDALHSISPQQSWQKNLAVLIDHLNMPTFEQVLTDFLATLCRFDSCLMVTYKESFRPIVIYPQAESEQSTTLLSFLENGYYLLDPLFNRVQSSQQSGIVRLSEICPDSFQSSDFYLNCYQYFDIVDETALIIHLNSKVTCTLSLNRQKALGEITRSELKALQELFPVIRSLVKQFWQIRASDYVKFASTTNTLKDALTTFGHNLLTNREQQITGLVLKGNSSQAIADALSISVGTVKVHRKNIHAKMNTSTQSELFNLFLDHLKTQLDHQPFNESDLHSLLKPE